MNERGMFRRHAMLGLRVPGFFPDDPDALLLNDAYYEFTHNGVMLPSWFASAYTDPAAFAGEHMGVLKRLNSLTTPPPVTEEDENSRTWREYKEWCFDTCGELWADDPRTPRERLAAYYPKEEVVEWVD